VIGKRFLRGRGTVVQFTTSQTGAAEKQNDLGVDSGFEDIELSYIVCIGSFSIIPIFSKAASRMRLQIAFIGALGAIAAVALVIRLRSKTKANNGKPTRIFATRKERVSIVTNEILHLFKLSQTKTIWIGICGVPGAGKTTFAGELAEKLNKAIPTQALPMDGYHYARKVLDTFPNPDEAHRRRGAPFTFDSKRFAKELWEGRDMIETRNQVAYVS
jgi:hypothetical protein